VHAPVTGRTVLIRELVEPLTDVNPALPVYSERSCVTGLRSGSPSGAGQGLSVTFLADLRGFRDEVSNYTGGTVTWS